MNRSEKKRLLALTVFEEEARSQGFQFIAGIDEAGRGPLAGPVVAGACIIPPEIYFPGVNDSKQLSAAQREELYSQITSTEGVHCGIGIATVEEIDAFNIFQATVRAMHRAIAALKQVPDMLLVDGLQLSHLTIPSKKIIKGDCKSQSIAAASILAKVTRDKMMEKYHEEWPHYGFKSHKGYPTEAHIDNLMKHGPCPIHRRSFQPVRDALGDGMLVSILVE